MTELERIASVAAGDVGRVLETLLSISGRLQLPNIQSETKSVGAGRTELVPMMSNTRIVVCAYAITTSETTSSDCEFWSSRSTKLWALKLTPAAGTTGANLAVSWPGRLFEAHSGESLEIVTSAAAVVSVTYWRE